MSSSGPTATKRVLSYSEHKKAIIESRTPKRIRADNHDSVADQDFELYEKNTFAWDLPSCPPRKEFTILDITPNTSIVCFYCF